MTQEYGLRFKVDSRDVKKAQADVDSLGRKAGDTERRVTGGNDRMSRSFDNLAAEVSSLNIKVGTLGNISKATQQTVEKLGNTYKTSSRGVNVMTESVDRSNRSARGASSAFSSLTAIISVASSVAALSKFVQISDQMTNLESRIRLTMKETDNYSKIQEQLNRVASNSVASLQDVGTLYARIAPSVDRLGGSQKDAIAITSALTNALRINGATSAEAGSAILQFSQAMQSGILRGEEFNALNENAGPLLDAMAKQLGVTRGELRAMAADGELTGDVLMGSILPAVKELQATADTMAVSVAAASQDLSDQLRIAVGELDDMTGATATLSIKLQEATTEVKSLVDNLANGELTEAQKNMIGIGGAVAGVATAYASVRTVLILVTAAQWAFNAAVRANPLIMGLSIITAGIAAVYGYEKATDAARSATQKLADAEKKLSDLEEKRDSNRSARGGVTKSQIEEAQGLVNTLKEKVSAEKAATSAASEAAEAAAKLAEEEEKRKQLTEEQIKLQKKAAEEYARAQQVIADAIESVADKVAKFNMSDSEAMMFDFNKLAPSPEQTARMAGFVEQFALLKQAEDNAKFAMDQYEESVKKADQTVADFLNRDIGLDLSAGFDAASQSIGQFVNAFEAVIDQQEAFRKAILAAGDDQIKVAKINQAQARAQVKQYGDMVGAAKGFFKEGSKGYKALSAAEQAFRVAEIALAIESFTVKTGLMQGEVLATFAKNAAIDASNAISAAISSMVGLPFPLNMAALAATVAVLATLGQAVGGGGGGSSGNQAALALGRGEGTTLGDPKQASESISASIERLREVARVDLGFSARMLSALNSIDAGVNGFAARIFQFRAETGARVRSISSPEASLTDVLAGQSGITVSATNRQSAAATANFQQDFVRGISGVVDAIRITGPQLGMAAEDIDQRINEIVLPAISARGLKKLKGDELAERINAIFSAAADVVAREALPGLDAFQRVGEGYFQTAVRVASGIEFAENALIRLGLTAINYTDIINQQGDVAAEIIRQSVLLVDTTQDIAGGFYEIVQNSQGTGEELIDLVLQLRELQDAIRATGKAGEYLTTFMIAGAGGVERLSDGLSAYFDEFLSPAEQAAELTRRLSNEFANIGRLLPENVDQFKDLISAQDLTTEAGQRMYGQLIALVPAFSELQDALSSVENEADTVSASITKAFADLRDAVRQAESELQAAFRAEQTAINATIKLFDDLGTKLREFVKGMVGLVDTPQQSLERLRSEFGRTVTLAKLGNVDAANAIPGIGNSLAQAEIGNAATAVDAARAISRIANEALNVAGVADRQKLIAEQQLDALTEQVDGLININDSTLQVRDAVNNLRALQSFENKAIADATAAGFAFLIGSSTKTLSAIEAGTLASQSIVTGINNLLTIQQQQAAAEQAETARRLAEQRRLDEISAISASGTELRAAVESAKSGKTSTIASINTLQSELNLIAKNTETKLIGSIGVTEEGLLDNSLRGATATGKNKNNMAKRLANFNAAFAAGDYANTINHLGMSLADYKSIIDPGEAELQRLRQQVISLGGIPQFATGGMHTGGWRVVGEQGPELEYTGPSRIFNANQSASMMDQSGVEQRLERLEQIMMRGFHAVEKNTGRTADQLRRWDDGDRMNVAIDTSDSPVSVRSVA